MRIPVSALAGLLLAALAHAPAVAQQQTAGTLAVTVTSAATGEPLRGAQVLVATTGIGGITGEEGTLLLERVPAGARTLEVRYLGFAPERAVVTLRAGGTTAVAFALAVRPIALAELRVRVAPQRSRLELTGFERRRARGMGTYIDRQQIESRRAYRLSDILRSVPGVALLPSGLGGDSRASMGRTAPGNRRCPIQYFVDGVQVFAFNIDDVRPHDVEGLEIYKGASQIPPDFNRGSAMCGVIVIWTRIRH